MIDRMSPEALAMKHHFLHPMEVTAVYSDSDRQARYDLTRIELEGFAK